MASLICGRGSIFFLTYSSIERVTPYLSVPGFSGIVYARGRKWGRKQDMPVCVLGTQLNTPSLLRIRSNWRVDGEEDTSLSELKMPVNTGILCMDLGGRYAEVPRNLRKERIRQLTKFPL